MNDKPLYIVPPARTARVEPDTQAEALQYLLERMAILDQKLDAITDALIDLGGAEIDDEDDESQQLGLDGFPIGAERKNGTPV